MKLTALWGFLAGHCGASDPATDKALTMHVPKVLNKWNLDEFGKNGTWMNLNTTTLTTSHCMLFPSPVVA